MRRIWQAIAAGLLCCSPMARAENVSVVVDVSSATAVLGAVRNPRLTYDEALRIARLAGNQGLIRKAQSYGRTATDALFAQALVAAARHDATFVDGAKFQFDSVRDHAEATEGAITQLGDPRRHLLDQVKARIAAFTPAAVTGRVTGCLVAGGTSGGFAFGDPQFFLDIDRFPSALLASTIMEHELFHAVQALARSAARTPVGRDRCLAAVPHAEDVSNFLGSLSAEGTASYVGDVLSIPDHGVDEASSTERAKFARNVGLVGRSVTQLELSIHGLTTGAAVSPEEVYALGFYGDEVMYPLGYLMARAIAREQGNTAIGELIGLSGAAFVDRYVHLKTYGKSEDSPALKPAAVAWAARLVACSRPG